MIHPAPGKYNVGMNCSNGSRSDEETRRAAYHEAGHATLAWLSGFAVRWARLVPAGPLAGGVLYETSIVRMPHEALNNVGIDMRILFVKCAGPAAESIYAGRLSYPLAVSQHDIESAHALLRRRGIHDRAALIDITARALLATERLLLHGHVWRAVALLAAELLTHRSLDREGIKQILKPCFPEIRGDATTTGARPERFA
jgi:hypothetical protein